ncbi:MAG: NAD(+)/NADH kinase [Flavobacteriales bacterium]|nr:NAD(+)/NADH kinase [Flavobacteriales bacterium]
MSSLIEHTKGLRKGPFLCIVNPHSGTGSSRTFIQNIEQYSDPERLDIEISKSALHSIELTNRACEEGCEAVIAVGGDGTVQEIAAQLIGSQTALGIVPTGSGNGIARHLGISMEPSVALKEMLAGKRRSMDTFRVNDKPGIGFAGVGVDGYVARLFDETNERGFSNYIKLSLDAFLSYSSTRFRVHPMEGDALDLNAMTVICANTSQLGNNAVVNATGVDDDGQLELILVKQLPTVNMMTLASRMFLSTLHKSPFVQVLTGRRFTLENLDMAELQVDGEVVETAPNLTFEVRPRSLHVLIP